MLTPSENNQSRKKTVIFYYFVPERAQKKYEQNVQNGCKFKFFVFAQKKNDKWIPYTPFVRKRFLSLSMGNPLTYIIYSMT